MTLPSRIPGVVSSVDRAAREVRVSIDGITDGADLLPLASMEYPIGDSSATTEIRVNPGDLVWLVFENGDARFPIITGYRCPRTGNEQGWRRWSHDNIELNADAEMHLTSQTLNVDLTETAEITAPDGVTITAGSLDVNLTGAAEVTAPDGVTITAQSLDANLQGEAEVTAPGGVTITAPQTDVEGNLVVEAYATGSFPTGSGLTLMVVGGLIVNIF